MEVQQPQLQEAGVLGTDWEITEIYFHKGVLPRVHLVPPPGPHPPPIVDTETEATKGTDAGKSLFLAVTLASKVLFCVTS